MSKSAVSETTELQQPIRKLSPWRVILGISIVIFLGVFSFFSTRTWIDARSISSDEPWFAPYVDVTAVPQYNFENTKISENKDVVLSFIVAKDDEACTPSWGSVYDLDEAESRLDLDRRIARLRQRGGDIAISFGGLLNDELAVSCKSEAELTRAYTSVIEKYKVNVVDFDLENTGLKDIEAGQRRAKVIAKIQKSRRTQNKKLSVWVTLPVAPFGMTEDGTNAIKILLENDVDIAGVNLMTMDYGQSLEKGLSMFEGSKSALTEAHRQLGILYENSGIYLNSGTLWSKIGATPMVGQNDVKQEVFNFDDATKLNDFARSNKISRMSMWSANRDRSCGDNYVNLKVVSDSCSGIDQGDKHFASILEEGFEGELSIIDDKKTVQDKIPDEKPDDPKTSPYQIWDENGTYLEGTKVVWRHNVYEAKWWTQDDIPDDPVLNSWETPWKLIGPVLPGEKPIKQTTLPTGTYSEWSGDKAYEAAQRVLFKGIPYQAKWWNKGESPAAASSNPDASPWVPLTQKQIDSLNLDQ